MKKKKLTTIHINNILSQVELHRTKGKPINAILDECIKDEEWLSMVSREISK